MMDNIKYEIKNNEIHLSFEPSENIKDGLGLFLNPSWFKNQEKNGEYPLAFTDLIEGQKVYSLEDGLGNVIFPKEHIEHIFLNLENPQTKEPEN